MLLSNHDIARERRPAVSIQSAWQGTFDFWAELPIVVQPSAARLTSDAGLLPLRQFDEHIGLTRQFAQALDDPRDPECCDHSFLEMVRSRIFGILAAYEDQNDPAAPIPAERTLQRWFQRAGLIPAPSGRRTGPSSYHRAQQPHEVWQMDAADQVALRNGKQVC